MKLLLTSILCSGMGKHVFRRIRRFHQPVPGTVFENSIAKFDVSVFRHLYLGVENVHCFG